ncbi:MAG: 50S ribosomal protein L9 [Aphanizomenon sp.]|jgi:large subunit ribosomal protein L9|uniref:Large ribosomal subunit protein bL9 n=2 Tax=Aphanizomenon flos-aquae TaxID=1176 RepID=A0A1B7X2U4_APHFL|nr:50S ribosomal protein L9 [Aphanizomenon flos-aquae Clear-A1]MBO1044762.1 50S ribosomal protein L9 [Aphanizomenon flos-aquae UKL13-PB]MBO1061323.1 50S ribosomal protein L9 [Aphanizomenon flos-aquae CP01]MDJ0505488.1 50S ribosomal protein L9 [Nostocales cyanobacterium LE14-WE12]NTW21687.1 50S ribosomal protein L9 [Nostocales cyanobacterium W4_Combined_metabat2_030]OBQ22366.1 MAG: 50S ribosomal protein L9 [Anabaena sp. WA113]OBQ25848.1 MAG: 50S ribosomal protein L9 [Aphanizomenon flos-aquae L
MAKRVQLVLTKDVNKLGKLGDLVEVAPGYARNYLIPQSLAARATPGLLKQVERRREKEYQRQLELKQQATEQKTALENIAGLKIAKQVGENEAIFGTVTTQDVADAIQAAASLEIDRRGITIPDIGKLGTYKAEIKLHAEVTAIINIEVVSN